MPSNDPLHIDYGALRVGRSLWLWRATLEIHPESIVLVCGVFWQHRYILPRSSVVRLSEEQQLFWFMFFGALRIDHTVASYPRFLFWSKDIEVLRLKLRQSAFVAWTPDV